MWMNQVTLAGNVGLAPTQNTSKNAGTKFTSFSVAVNSKGKGENAKSTTDWPKVLAFGTIGEAAYRELKKGTPVFLQGALKTYTKDGIQRYYVRLNTFTIQAITKAAVEAAHDDVADEDIPV